MTDFTVRKRTIHFTTDSFTFPETLRAPIPLNEVLSFGPDQIGGPKVAISSFRIRYNREGAHQDHNVECLLVRFEEPIIERDADGNFGVRVRGKAGSPSKS